METESGNMWSDPADNGGSHSSARAGGHPCWNGRLASPGATLNVGMGLEKGEFANKNRGAGSSVKPKFRF